MEILVDDYEHYASDNVLYTPVSIPGPGVDMTLFEEQFEGCTCPSLCASDCSCMRGCSSTYYTGGVLSSVQNPPLMIYECHDHCLCNDKCPNRIVQKGPHCGLRFIETGFKGKGINCSVDLAPGTFVCEYAGEVIGAKEARSRFAQRKNDSNYIFCLREHFGPAIVHTYVDPTFIGNIGRYINHACDPNLMVVPVRTDTTVPKICLFACRDIAAGTELTFDYAGDCNVATGEGETRSVCHCGTSSCRGFLPFDKSLGLFPIDM